MSSQSFVAGAVSPTVAFVEALFQGPQRISPHRPAGVEDEPELAPRAGERATLHELAARARSAGMRAEVFNAPPAAVLGRLDPARPCVAFDAAGELLVLSARRGARVRVRRGGEHFWWTAPELARALGAEVGQELPWLSLAEASEPIHVDSSSAWRQVGALLEGERPNLVAIVTYAVGVGLLSLALPLAVQSLVNTVAFGQLIQPIFVLSVLLAMGLVFGAALRTMQAWVVEIVQRRLFVRLVSELGQRLPRAHVTAFERGEGPELVNRFFDVFTAQKSVASLLLGGVEALLTLSVGLLVLAFYHPILLAFGLLLLVSGFGVFFLLGRGATYSSIKESKAKYAVAGWLEEMVRHLFALKTAGGGDYFVHRLDTLSAEWLTARGAHFRIYFRQFIGALGIQVVAHAGLLAVGGYLVVERQLTIGQLVAAELIVTAVVASRSKLGGKLESLYDRVAAADKLGALLNVPVERRDEGDPLPAGPALEVELRDVRPEGGCFAPLSLRVAAGDSLAVAGDARQTAALADMLFGLRLPAAGTILLDGRDLRDLRLSELRDHVAVVREPETLPGTIADNVRAAVGEHGEMSATEVWTLLDEVGLGERVRALPRGLQTELLPSGAPLDRHAQLQLTLARALAADPALLVLDRVLDAWPPDEREALFESLANGRSLIVLTQDVTNAERCAAQVVLSAPAPRSEGPLDV